MTKINFRGEDMKTVGIIGGMGPMATVDLFKKIIDFTDAHSDRDHLHVITDSYCEIPDRTSYILGMGENPLSYILESAGKLKKIGADFLVMPCNTAHYFYRDITSAIDIPVINMVEETAKSLVGCETVGLLATKGTYEGRVYDSVFEEFQMKVISPSDEIKDDINKLIYEYKGGCLPGRDRVKKVVEYFQERGIKKIILGCTELPLIFKGYQCPIELIDPTEILSKAAIKYAGKNIVV